MATDGATNRSISERLGLSPQSVSKWRQRYLQQVLAGPFTMKRPTRPRPILDQQLTDSARRTLKTQPREGAHWTVRSMARETPLSPATVHRIWRAFDFQPHWQRHFRS